MFGGQVLVPVMVFLVRAGRRPNRRSLRKGDSDVCD